MWLKRRKGLKGCFARSPPRSNRAQVASTYSAAYPYQTPLDGIFGVDHDYVHVLPGVLLFLLILDCYGYALRALLLVDVNMSANENLFKYAFIHRSKEEKKRSRTLVMVMAWTMRMRTRGVLLSSFYTLLFLVQIVPKDLRVIHNLEQKISVGNDGLVRLLQLLLVA